MLLRTAPTSRRTPRSVHAMAAALCLTTALGLAGCSGDNTSDAPTNASSQETSSGGGLSQTSASPNAEASQSAGSGLATVDPNGPGSDATVWSPPDLKFHNENWSYWYQDDSVTNQEAITENGNLEGYRTYSHTCVGFARRDISIAVYNSTLDDATLSDVRVDGSIEVDDYAETARETVSLVRSDAGNLEGYNATFTGTVSDGSSTIPVTGYRFARTVKSYGLNFEVMLTCRQGTELSLEQWHEILSGIRIEGLDATTMEED